VRLASVTVHLNHALLHSIVLKFQATRIGARSTYLPPSAPIEHRV